MPIIFAEHLIYHACDYQGQIAEGKPHGKGALICPDGQIYTGQFVNGAFHGKGQYIIPNKQGINITPFSLNSDKLKGMVLDGNFSKGMANGKFKVYQNGKHMFNFTFKNGIAIDMKLAK